jgi:hypothetical protein
MFSIYTTAGVLVTTGPDGKPYPREGDAMTSARDRNERAEKMGLKVRYEARPVQDKAAA